MPQHIHRFSILEELPNCQGLTCYSAALPGSPAVWTLLKWSSPQAATKDSQNSILLAAQNWLDEGVESFVYRGDLYFASQDRPLLEQKVAQVQSGGPIGSVTPAPAPAPASVRLPAPPPVPVPKPAPAPPPPVVASAPPPPPNPARAPVIQPRQSRDPRLTTLSGQIDQLMSAMANWQRTAPKAAGSDLTGDAAELWQLGEQVRTAQEFDSGHLDTFTRLSRSTAIRVVFSADTALDPKRIDQQVQNALTQAVAAASLELIEPPLNSDPRLYGANVLSSTVRGGASDRDGTVAIVERRGLRCGSQIVQNAQVRVWDSNPSDVKPQAPAKRPPLSPPPLPPPLPPGSATSEPAVAPNPPAKPSRLKWFVFAIIGIGTLAGALSVVERTPTHIAGLERRTEGQPTPVSDPSSAKFQQTAFFHDPKSNVEFSYPQPPFEKIAVSKANELIRLKSADGVTVSVAVAPAPPNDAGQAMASSYRRELAASPNKTITYKTGIRSGWYVVSGYQGPVIFYRRVLNPPGYIATMTIFNRRDLTPSSNPAIVIGQTFKVGSGKELDGN